MIENLYYSREGHGPYKLYDVGSLDLEEGGTLHSCKLAVATHGELNEAKDNAILVPTWYSGTSKIIEQVYIGKGRALDPDKYFIIVVNQIGSGLSTSPHNSTDAAAGPAFPKVRIGDDVRAQHRLVTETFGVNRLALVVGGSMGAQQTYEWAVRFPEFVQRAAPIAGTAKFTEQDFVMLEALGEAITTDPGFRDGDYGSAAEVAAGLKRHAKLWTLFGWSTEFFRAGRHRAMGFDTVQSFVDNFMTGYFAPMDPNDLLAQAWKCQRADVSRHADGDLAAALGRIKAKTFVMPISHDVIFPPGDCEPEQKLIPGSVFRPLTSIDGHLALFGTDSAMLAQLDANLKELLAIPV
ncbi:alpha/beta fold hydrolase [Burkholderia cepacia]|uniref:alpha/beta fold hydrolase n=1 Tax=Burkholderia cepacia TaxID=292 RepID=UPI002AB6CAF5|nr:alpha/beta fold hydrolase [Burkholderia cepacia]